MAENKEDIRSTYTIYDDETVGTVQVADDVVMIIAALAATEAEGVASLAGGITADKVGKMSAKSISKGVRVEVTEGIVKVRIALQIRFGSTIPETAKKVQEKVRSAIENMTGLTVSDVDISVTDLQLETAE